MLKRSRSRSSTFINIRTLPFTPVLSGLYLPRINIYVHSRSRFYPFTFTPVHSGLYLPRIKNLCSLTFTFTPVHSFYVFYVSISTFNHVHVHVYNRSRSLPFHIHDYLPFIIPNPFTSVHVYPVHVHSRFIIYVSHSLLVRVCVLANSVYQKKYS